MCTNFVLTQLEHTDPFANTLGVNAELFRYSSDNGPGSTISIIVERQQRQVLDATWWLYLRQTPDGLKPHPVYFSVNTNWKKLPQKSEYKTHRCIVPVSAWAESQGGKNPHLLAPEHNQTMGFGGLWKQWLDKTTGDIHYSASIITLAGHPALEHIHAKSTPLWLPENRFDAWLDPHNKTTEVFNDLLTPHLQTSIIATPIDRIRSKNKIGEAFLINRTMLNDIE